MDQLTHEQQVFVHYQILNWVFGLDRAGILRECGTHDRVATLPQRDVQ
jgi:hypothetical protein